MGKLKKTYTKMKLLFLILLLGVLYTRALIKLHMMLSQVVQPNLHLLNVICPRTEDADQNSETLSAHLDIVQNGGGAVPQLYTRALTRANMTPSQLVPPRRPSRRSSRSQRSRSPLRRRLPRNQRLLSRSQRSRSPLKRRSARRLSRSQRSRSPLKRRSPRSQRSRSPLKRRLPRRLSRRLPRRLSSQR